MISSPAPHATRIASWFAMVPLGTNTAASLPKRAAIIASKRATVGSSPRTSSPSGAERIASHIAAQGWVTVSERRSTECSAWLCILSLFFDYAARVRNSKHACLPEQTCRPCAQSLHQTPPFRRRIPGAECTPNPNGFRCDCHSPSPHSSGPA